MDELEPSPTPPPSRRRRRVRRLIGVLAGLTAVWLLLSLGIAYKLTHRKRPPFPEPAPAVAWGAIEEHRLRTGDGEEIGAWFADGRDDAPSLLFLHGNGGGRSHCLERAGMVAADLGCAAMLISMRAHGDSTGESNDIGYSARRDVVAAVDFLRDRRPGRPVVVFGVSLGSAAAAFAAADLGRKVDAYVLESPYRDLKTAVWNRTHAYLPAGLDLVAYLGLRFAGLAFLPHLDAIAPVEAVAAIPVETPVLILAGGADDLATPDEARALFERVRDHARLEVFQAATHRDLDAVEPERYRRTIVDFIASATRARD